MVLRGVVCAGVPVFRVHHFQPEHHFQDLPDHPVDRFLGDFTGLHHFLQRVGVIILVVAVADVHVEMHACLHRLFGVVHSAPVGNDDPAEAPLIPQEFLHQVLVLAAVFPPELVVSPHNGQASALLDGRLEAGQVQLVQGPLVHLHVDVITAGFLVVGDEVLDAGGDVVFLNSLDLRHAHFGNQIRILGHVLEVPAAKGRAVDVNSGREGNVLSPAPDLPPQGLAVFIGHVGVPGGGHGSDAGEAGG